MKPAESTFFYHLKRSGWPREIEPKTVLTYHNGNIMDLNLSDIYCIMEILRNCKHIPRRYIIDNGW
ncbi:hypothetical protein YC2023_061403 [Brassica napus]